MDWINKLPEWLKLSPRYLLPISLVSGFLLFANESILARFGYSEFVGNFRPWISVTFLITASLIVVDMLYQLVNWLKSGFANTRSLKKRLERFRNLTPEEKGVFLGYLLQNTRTLYFPLSDGVVTGLEAEGFVYKSSNVGHPGSWSFNIQPWAWTMLKGHSKEIFSDEEIESYKNSSKFRGRKIAR
jgi:hypothetical protein